MKDEKPSKLPETTTSQDNPVPTATPTTESRRRLLKRLATGGGVVAAGGILPTKWASPVVESVLLPAHAAGTPTPGGGLECGPESTLGQLTCMTLMNTGGASTGNITLHWSCPGGGDQSDNVGPIAAGASFTICGGDGAGGCNKDVFQNNLEVRDNGVCEAVFHTSCSAKIGPGTQCGPWLITAASVESGDLANVGSDTTDGCNTCP